MPPSEQEQNAFWAGAAPEGRARFTDVRIIGSGAYSVVARATDTKTSQPVAIKRIAEVFYDAQDSIGLVDMRPARIVMVGEHQPRSGLL